MIIYVVRHGETDGNRAGIVVGRSSESLNKTGITQAHAIKQQLKDTTFDAIYVSPIKRTIETADIITPGNYRLDPRIAERHIGSLSGSTIDELWQNPLWNSLTELQTAEGAETFGAGILRVQGFLDELRAKSPDARILLITHSFVSRCIWAITNHIASEQDSDNFLHPNDVIRIYEY